VVAQGVLENMRMVGKGATGRKRDRKRENSGDAKAVIRALGVLWG